VPGSGGNKVVEVVLVLEVVVEEDDVVEEDVDVDDVVDVVTVDGSTHWQPAWLSQIQFDPHSPTQLVPARQVPAAQAPLWQTSPTVHWLPSLHAVPSGCC
jgi:hypothetical protein